MKSKGQNQGFQCIRKVQQKKIQKSYRIQTKRNLN